MPENNQVSDKTKPEATGSSSTQPGSQAIDMNHTNVIVPHRISNHDKLVQTMVMVDGEWVNVNDTNDQKNVQEDMHKVNRVVTEAQKDIINAQNAADSAVKSADSAIRASKVNSDAIVAQSSAISEAKIALDSATTEIQLTASNAASDAASIRADVAKVQSEVNTAKTANETEAKSIRDDLKMANSSIATVKDHLGNVSSELDTYAKSAAAQEHDITIIRQKQGQFEVDYAGTKGDVNQIKANIKGLSENLKNSEGDVASLQVTAKKLQSSMSDAEGNISNLQVTAKSYDKIFEDHLGRISKVEQTASKLTNEFSDQQGHLNRVEQTAQGTQQTVANQQGQINMIKTDASGIHETLTGQGDKIATINVTLDSLKSKYEGVSGDLTKLKNGNQWKTVTGAFDANQYTQTAHIFYQDMQAKNTPDPGWFYFLVEAPRNDRVTQTLIKDNSENSWSRFYNGTWSAWAKGATQLDIDSLSNRITTNSTQITQNKKAIALKADQTTVDNLSGEVNQNKAQLKVQADQISSKVSSSDFKTLDNKVSGAIARIDENATAIDQTNKQISLKADQTTVDKIKNTATQNSSRLDVMANEISSKVTSTDVNNIVDKKGYATTSTVQSLITQKAGTISESITNLDAKYSAKDGVNLATKTGNVSLSGGYNSSKNIGYISLDAINDLCGKYMTISVDVEWSGWKSGNQNRVGYELQINYDDGSTEYDGSWITPTTANGKQRATATYKIKDQHVKSLDEGNAYIQINCTSAKVSHLKIERGTVATPWTPAPSDNATVTQLQSITASIDGLQSRVTNYQNDTSSKYTQLSNLMQSKVGTADFEQLKRSVDMQTLDSADINNMKTNGHYFVHNLANNPIGGWVYVDVTGDGKYRIRQDVYQDSWNKHKFRNWYGDHWTNWEEGATYSEITQLQDAINLRVQKDELLSQINIEAGRTLIQSNKIYFDADSFVMSANSKAFIPSAYITNINADKITTGTLDAAKFNVKNFSADNIVGGTLNGVVVKTGTNDRYFQTSKDNIYWVRNDGMSLVGNDTYLNRANGLNIADMNNIQLTTWGGASVNPDGSIVNTSGNAGHPKIVVDTNGNWDPDDPYGTKWGGGPGDSEIVQWIGNKEYTALTRGKGFIIHLNGGNNNSKFAIQKDNKIGAYFGSGDNGDKLSITAAGITFNTALFSVCGEVHIPDHGLTVKALHVTNWFGADGYKSSIVRTSQGTVAINAYETAEYYFGDIGEDQTNGGGKVWVSIDYLFGQTVNTSVPYQVFVTPYSSAHVWVSKRLKNRFLVESDKPNASFAWEIKAKRKGYEHTRLKNVDNMIEKPAGVK